MHYKRYYAILTVFYFFLFFRIRMTEKGGKKKTIENNKKVSQDKKITITARLSNGIEIPAKNIYKEDSKVFKINDIGIDKIRVSDKLYNKEHGSYKHYVFYEDGNEYIPLKITLLDVHGYYNIFKGNSKIMNFDLDDNSLEKVIDIFNHIGKILNIDLDNYM